MAYSRTISNSCDSNNCKKVAVIEVYRADNSYYGKYCQDHADNLVRNLTKQEELSKIRERHEGEDTLQSDFPFMYDPT